VTAVDTPPAPPQRRPLPARSRVPLVCVLVAAAWLILDQATKVLAVARLSDGPVNLGVFDLRLVFNPRGAFGLPGFPGLFVIVTVLVLVIVARTLPGTERLSLAAAYGLIVGGALGNVVDRVVRPPYFPSGAVVDFIDLRWWPVFNIADIGIVTGAGLVFLLMVAVDREERAAEQRRALHESVRPETGLPRQ
jgi:signal peptidase II